MNENYGEKKEEEGEEEEEKKGERERICEHIQMNSQRKREKVV